MSRIVIQCELLSDIIDEFKPLAREADLETRNVNLPEMDIDWGKYLQLESLDMFKIITVRLEGKLIGYLVSIITTGLHYSNHKFATVDSVYVSPCYRGGTISYRLIKESVKYLKDIGADVVQLYVKTHIPFDKLCTHLGFKESERVYIKVLGESNGD